MDKPNIIYIMLDEWGYFEWSAMNHPILETPNIDKMASEGMRITQILAGGNVCAPTQCASKVDFFISRCPSDRKRSLLRDQGLVHDDNPRVPVFYHHDQR